MRIPDPPMGGVRDAPPLRSDPRWGSGGPSLICEGKEVGMGGESLFFGEGLLGEVTLFGRGGASRSPLLAVRLIGGGRRSWRGNEGEPCRPLAVEGEAEVWWGMAGGRDPRKRGGAGLRLTEMLSTLDGVSSPRSTASTAANKQTNNTHDPMVLKVMTLYLH